MVERVEHLGADRRRMVRRRLGISAVVLVMVLMGGGIGLYLHLNGNLHTTPLTDGGHDSANASGHIPINVLVIGSDTRAGSEDCKIGGDCSPASATDTKATSAAANADVLMVVHISGDRSNSTVMSIPRDTVINVPACTDTATGAVETVHSDRINSTLQYGANCTADAVHQLTGIPIDHFMVIDFAGVVAMSDAVGGVTVCVNNDVYDPYSHLKLAKGTHTLTGRSALEFLRTRHGFGDGGDIGRTVAQHLFLSSMLRNMESTSTLANPVKVLRLADAATSAVTVDPGLGSVPALTTLAYQLNEVPGSRTTFVTMPTVADPANQEAVIPASNAASLFAQIAQDISLSSARVHPAAVSSKPSVSPTASEPTREPAATVPSGQDDATTVTSARGCAQVSTARTVVINGVAMTPTRAFLVSPKIPVSAP